MPFKFFFSVSSNVYAHGIPKEENSWELRIEKSAEKSTMTNFVKYTLGAWL